jgi:hypothetical protein
LISFMIFIVHYDDFVIFFLSAERLENKYNATQNGYVHKRFQRLQRFQPASPLLPYFIFDFIFWFGFIFWNVLIFVQVHKLLLVRHYFTNSYWKIRKMDNFLLFSFSFPPSNSPVLVWFWSTEPVHWTVMTVQKKL